MKKLMFAAAAAFCGTVAMAVESQIVGYLNATRNNVFKMTAAQFQTCDGEETLINGTVQCVTPMEVPCWNEPFDEYDMIDPEIWQKMAPQIQVPKVGESGYNYYWYVSNARSPIDEENAGAGWVTEDGYLSDGVVPTGFGIWTRGYTDGVEIVADTAFTFNGAVSSAATESVEAAAIFKLRAIPYPKNAGLNDNLADWENYLTGVLCWNEPFDEYDMIDPEIWQSTAPQIQVPKVGESGYNYYWYVSNARSPIDEENAGAGWVTEDGYLSDGVIPAGFAIWINARRESIEIPIKR